MSDDKRAEPVVPTAAESKSLRNLIAVALLGLAVGATAGWFGHLTQAKLSADDGASTSAAASQGEPCAALEKEICAKSGDNSALCSHAKGAATLLTPGACERALLEVPAMVQKGNAARAVCNELVTRLCSDLTPTSPACAMVKERTEGFGPERCAELSGNYDAVLAEAKQLERRGMIPGAPPQEPRP